MNLDHPNICRFYECYIDPHEVYIVMDYVEGENFGEVMENYENQILPEQKCCKYLKDLFQTICHMHEQDIAHRDLKPENIMLDKDDQLKLIDFGLAKRMRNQTILKDAVGTPYFVAPEILANEHDLRCDLWSLGVILYIFLSGIPPFDGDDLNQLFSRIKKGTFDFEHSVFQNVSDEAKDLIKKLILVDPSKRISAQNALKHPWFKKMGQGNIIDDPELNKSLL